MQDWIEVRPLAVGWFVEARSFANGLTFRSGAAAEQAARRLAEDYARAGRSTAVRIYLRDGSLAGRILYAAADDALAIAG